MQNDSQEMVVFDALGFVEVIRIVSRVVLCLRFGVAEIFANEEALYEKLEQFRHTAKFRFEDPALRPDGEETYYLVVAIDDLLNL